MTKKPDRTRIIGVTEAAKLLSLTTARVRRFCQTGRLGQWDDFAGKWRMTVGEVLDFDKIARPAGVSLKTTEKGD
jgi:hypothetical protein